MTQPLVEQVQNSSGQPATVRVGRVASVSPFTVSAQGVVFTDVGWLGSYLPNLGDVVILLGQSPASGPDPGSWVALGATSPTVGKQVHITQLRRNAAQSIATASFTAISWDGIIIDTMGGFSGASTDFVAPFSGYYEFTGHASFASNATGQRQSLWFLNGGSTDSFVSMEAVAGGLGTRWEMHTFLVNLAVGDIVQMLLWQNTGGNLSTETAVGTRPTMSVRFLGTAVD